MSPSFLFTAQNKNGKQVSERVEAETLAAAKYKLEIQGYSEIEFLESELSNDIRNLFNEEQAEATNQMLDLQAERHYKSGWHHSLLTNIKLTAIIWVPLSIWSILSDGYIPLVLLGGFASLIAYFFLPVFIYHQFITAHFWANSRRVRFWGKIANGFNFISLNRIPDFEIETRLACADAREGNLHNGLRRIEEFTNDPKVSKRLISVSKSSVYMAAKKYDEALTVKEASLREGNLCSEELIDYAFLLALNCKKTYQAREVVERVLDMQLSVLAAVYLPFCQGVIETEDGNNSQAEFYLHECSKEMTKFEKNSNLDGLRCMLKTFLAISSGKKGNTEEAKSYFREAKSYLIAHNETELIQRCEDAIG